MHMWMQPVIHHVREDSAILGKKSASVLKDMEEMIAKPVSILIMYSLWYCTQNYTQSKLDYRDLLKAW